jgi:hypothetical protein
MKEDRNLKAKINLECDKDGNMTKSIIGGNVGSMFSMISATFAYLIENHNLDVEQVLNTMNTSVKTALETIPTDDTIK